MTKNNRNHLPRPTPDDRADKYLWSDSNRGTVEFVGISELAADGGQSKKRRKRGSRRRRGSKNPKD